MSNLLGSARSSLKGKGAQSHGVCGVSCKLMFEHRVFEREREREKGSFCLVGEMGDVFREGGYFLVIALLLFISSDVDFFFEKMASLDNRYGATRQP